MGAGACVVIIEGNTVQGMTAMLSATASASCQLLEYLREEPNFNPADEQPIIDEHLKLISKLKQFNNELDAINRAFAAKYNS